MTDWIFYVLDPFTGPFMFVLEAFRARDYFDTFYVRIEGAYVKEVFFILIIHGWSTPVTCLGL